MSVRILIVGANGMLGHEAIKVLAPDFEVWGACRSAVALGDVGIRGNRIVTGLDAADPSVAAPLVEKVRPDLVLNAVGIVKQRAEAQNASLSIAVNSLWPHALADACEPFGARVVQVGTDCVFSGSRGCYRETDIPDATDLYGRSKLLGELTGRANAITLRTSIIGWQLEGSTGLLEWFASHRHEPLAGYTRAVFSGVTTRVLTELVRDVVLPDESLSGLWHVAAEPIDKHTLLTKLAAQLGWEADIAASEEVVIDRSLDGSAFGRRTGWRSPSWDAMLTELAEEYVGREAGE